MCWLRTEPSELRSDWMGESARPTCSFSTLAFFVLAGFVDGEAAEFVGDFEQVLVAFVPLRADFAEEHRALVGPSQLEKSYFAGVGAKPARIFHVLGVGELRGRKPLHQFVELGAFRGPGMHGEEGC